MDVLEEFEAGINAYYSGDIPEGWDDAGRRARSPFLMGWYMESEADNYGPDYFSRDGIEHDEEWDEDYDEDEDFG